MAVLQSINAEIAFDGGFLVIVILHGSEGTGFQTLLAADAQFFIDENQPHFISGNRIHRASLLARCLGTMVTIDREKIR